MAKKVKIRVLSNCYTVITVVLSVICITVSILGFQKYSVLRSAMNDYVTCEAAAQQFSLGSDILTKQVRLAASSGEQSHIDAYFEEADTTQNREKALKELERLDSETGATAALREALSYSVELMETEYYSMRLVEEATHANPGAWPEKLKEYTLTAADSALSDDEKLHLAQKMVISEDYEYTKDQISEDVGTALEVLTGKYYERQQAAARVFSDVLQIVILCVIVFAVMMLCNSLIVRSWMVMPLVKYTENIRQGLLAPLNCVNELQILVDTYNKVYLENEEREKLMKHQAEHDPLTEALNRGAFSQILNLFQQDGSSFALILIDIDNFKTVNDTYGHAIGDMILKETAEQLKTAFRSIDYVFRIGGDEFAIIMVNMTSDLAYTVTEKISEVNRNLSAPETDEIPPVSLSVGVAFTDRENPGESLFKDADAALYYTKENGRSGCHFYPVHKENV